jgi:hypothetical protein
MNTLLVFVCTLPILKDHRSNPLPLPFRSQRHPAAQPSIATRANSSLCNQWPRLWSGCSALGWKTAQSALLACWVAGSARHRLRELGDSILFGMHSSLATYLHCIG